MTEDDNAPATRSDLATMSSALRGDIKSLGATLVREIAAAEERTRRHFDIVGQRIESHFKPVVDANSHLRSILDNHEARLQEIELRRP